MKITLEPTGRFEAVGQDNNGYVRCRVWEGVTDSGAKVIAHIPMVGLHEHASPAEHAAWAEQLRAVKVEAVPRPFDIRMVL